MIRINETVNVDGAVETKDSNDKKRLCVEARIREMLPSNVKVSSEFLDELSKHVTQILSDSLISCQRDDRNTLKARDVENAANIQVNQLRQIIGNAIKKV